MAKRQFVIWKDFRASIIRPAMRQTERHSFDDVWVNIASDAADSAHNYWLLEVGGWCLAERLCS